MVGKLYYTQYTLLSNMRQLPFFFFFEKQTHTHTHTHTEERERDFNTNAYHNSTQKSW